MSQGPHHVPKGAKPYKVILVGGQAVGKSSLLHRIIEAKFDPNYTSTIGVDFKTVVVTVGLKQVVLQVWDTAGQQKFRALTQSYFRSSQGCICVYDINQPETLQKADAYLRDAFQYKISPDCIYLLANKSDQCQKQQAEKQGKILADKYQINFLKVSAKTGQGLENLIGNLATKIDSVFGSSKQHSSEGALQKRPTIKIQQNKGQGRCAC